MSDTSSYWTGKMSLYEYLTGVPSTPSNWYASLLTNLKTALTALHPPNALFNLNNLNAKIIASNFKATAESTILALKSLITALTTQSKTGFYGLRLTFPSFTFLPSGHFSPSSIKLHLESDNVIVSLLVILVAAHYLFLILGKNVQVKDGVKEKEREYSRSR